MNLPPDMCIDCLAITRIVIVFCLFLLALQLPHKMFLQYNVLKLSKMHWDIFIIILNFFFNNLNISEISHFKIRQLKNINKDKRIVIWKSKTISLILFLEHSLQFTKKWKNVEQYDCKMLLHMQERKLIV